MKVLVSQLQKWMHGLPFPWHVLAQTHPTQGHVPHYSAVQLLEFLLPEEDSDLLTDTLCLSRMRPKEH